MAAGPAAAGVAAVLTDPAPASAATTSTSAGYLAAPDLGITPGNDAALNRANLVAALADSTRRVTFPPGDYRLDNAPGDATDQRGGIRIAGFAGELDFQPGARVVFTDNTRRGLVFAGGAGARIHGLTSVFAARPTVRQNARECLSFDTTSDTYLADVRIDGSAAAGVLFWQCVRPTVVDAVITGTMADGLNFSNCQDGRADRITTVDTGDDGVAFGNYASGPAYTGGLGTNLSVTNSRSRGIAVWGQSGVTIRDAVVDTTVGHGVYCAYESSWGTRVPNEVTFERIRVRRGGWWTVAAGGGTNSGLRITDAGRVRVSDVAVDEPGANGVSVSGQGVVAVLLDARVGNATGSGFLLQRSTCHLDRVTADGTDGIGLNVVDCPRLEYGSVTLRNTARTHPTHRAVQVQNTQTSAAYVIGERLWIHDEQSTATGYVVTATGSLRGTFGTVVDLVSSRDVVLESVTGFGSSRL
ncbi:Pectate lyase superfamily protein [Micromonospora auratinigra]|uniref:Pectate lyase superfamily protein n=2 Tax=Micromonospora auratinigra TaxID=261654 RepID=A0A1A8Z775_9ACTN|nr:Pectate lyase superfamily protein [Micromonospora auratinigra]